MRSPILLSDPQRQYLELRDDIDDAVATVIGRGVFTPDIQVQALEAEFAEWNGLPFAVGVGSGSAALTLALNALDVGPGDHVAVTANLDISAVAPISRVGAEPLFVDIDPATHTMSPADLERRLTDRTRAVVVVHTHGNPAAMTDLLAVADARSIPVVEDATLGPGARVAGRRVGRHGVIGCYSLAPTKPLGAFGNAGMVVTSSREIADRVRVLANYGFRADSVAAIRSGEPLATFHYEEPGINASMDELQAAVLRIKLSMIDEWADRRRANAGTYRSAFAAIGDALGQLQIVEDALWSPRSYVIEHDHRDRIARLCNEAGVRTALHYVPPLHVQAPYGEPSRAGSLPATEQASSRLLCLPVGPELSPEEVDFAAAAVRNALARLT